MGTEELRDGRARRALRAFGAPPLVFAHRGASGYLPEHSLEAYALAYGLGAHVLEPDLVMTRDHVLICLHDIHLERVTDVARVFPGRARDDGSFHALDFTLDEVRRLAATGGQRHGIRGCGVATFEEFLGLVRHLEERVGQPVAIAPEMKKPAAHAAGGADLVGAVARSLKAAGLASGPDARCVVQCFEEEGLVALKDEHGVECARMLCTGKEPPTAAELDRIAGFADMLGASRKAVEAGDGALVADCHRRGIAVVPYTFGDEREAMAEHFGRFGVDGLFTDFTDVGLRARDDAAGR